MSDSYENYKKDFAEYNFLCKKHKIKSKRFSNKRLEKIRKIEYISKRHPKVLKKYLKNKNTSILVFFKYGQRWQRLSLDFIKSYCVDNQYKLNKEDKK